MKYVSVFWIFELYNCLSYKCYYFLHIITRYFFLIHALKILFEITKYSVSFQDDSETMIQSDFYHLVDRTLYLTSFPLLYVL